MENCLNCSEPTRKYRCSQCSNFCCSLPCYKTHTEKAICSKPVQEKDDSNTNEDTESAQRLQMFTTEDTVDVNKLKQLESSERLRELLHNPHLRNYLVELDRTPDAWKAMKVAMLEPLFVEFANECLNVVEPDTQPSLPKSPTEEVVTNLCTAIIQQMDG